jgi:hypothetical protein
MPAVGRRRSQRADGDDNPQSSVSALGVATLAHAFDHIPRLRHGSIAMLRDPLMGGAVETGILGRDAPS